MLELYHGTTQAHAAGIRQGIKLTAGAAAQDFGQGFYTTIRYAQALDRGVKLARFTRGTAEVMVFRVRVHQLRRLKILKFTSAGDEWASFVSKGRLGVLKHGHDIVMGPALKNVQHMLKGAAPVAWSNGWMNFSWHTARAAKILQRGML